MGGEPVRGKDNNRHVEARPGDVEAVAAALADLSKLLNEFATEAANWAARVSAELVRCYSSGGKVLCCGNGGSASQAEHVAAELVVKFYEERTALPALSLTDNTAILTAVSNDLGYDAVFSRQIEGLGQAGDVLLAFSTSGKSPNILEGIKTAREKGLLTVGFTGERGADLAGHCDYCLVVPSGETPRIQEVHLAVAHSICALAEAATLERS